MDTTRTVGSRTHHALQGIASLLRLGAIPWTALSYVALFVVALVPRVLGLGGFVNFDEAQSWIARSETFVSALQSGDFRATITTEHPGVTTMWLGGAGVLLRSALDAGGFLPDQRFPVVLTLMRLPVVVVHVAGILLGYYLLRRLLPPLVALLAALLWAADPFVIGYSRILHVDALMGTFATLSVLAACWHWHHGAGRRWLVLSGVCAGLAMLSKSPALMLVPVAGAIAWTGADAARHPPRGRFGHAARGLAVWSLVGGMTVVALWPALWTDPIGVYRTVVQGGIDDEGMRDHPGGNFFLGQPDPTPGPLFYPVALAMRLTPWTLAGLLLLAYTWRRARREVRGDLAGLALWAVLLIVGLSLFDKKLNRYLVPIFPALDILAAAGLAGLVPAVPAAHQFTRRIWGRLALSAGLLGSVTLAALGNAAYWHPYGIVAFNQLFGGLPRATKVFAMGSGEGMEHVAAWLNQQRDFAGGIILASEPSILAPYMWNDGRNVLGLRKVTERSKDFRYLVAYIRELQQGPLRIPPDLSTNELIPMHTVRIKGVDYAWVYRVPPAVTHKLLADFGPVLHLHGVSVSVRNEYRRGTPLLYRLRWQVREKPARDHMLFAHLLAADGSIAARLDLPAATSNWLPGEYITQELTLPLPEHLPPGEYRLVAGLYELETMDRLPATVARATPALAGPDAVLMETMRVR